MAFIPTPFPALYSKASAGISDVSSSGNVYKFLGCSVLSINSVVGFNGTSSSLNIDLVEDTEMGNSFQTPNMPQALAFSLPSGGIGSSIFVSDSFSFNPNGFTPSNVPFNFAGICTGFQKSTRDISGKTISVNIVDPREILKGVQCLLGGFALSQNFTGSNPRYSDVSNIIDVFGYYDYGMTSDKNEFGMLWDDIQTVLEAVAVIVNGIRFEFLFTGEAFTNAPSWYRINEEIIDIVSLAEKVVSDGGSDLICIGRKVASNAIVVEFRAIRRSNTDPLTQSELSNFINARSQLVEYAKVGREYRNEPTSAVIIGGLRNSNYTAYPTEYSQSMHLRLNTCTGTPSVLQEDYNAFPIDIKTRLFGGSGIQYQETCTGSGLNPIYTNFSINTGAIFPFWGFSPSGTQYPLVEPFLHLDHLFFDKQAELAGNLKDRIPRCKIGHQNYTVREVAHQQMFLDGDEDSDSRPFAYIEDVIGGGSTLPAGYVRGLPLNTEVLRAAMAHESTFFFMYSIHYPQYALEMGMPYPNFQFLRNLINRANERGGTAAVSGINLENFHGILEYENLSKAANIAINDLARTADGKINISDFTVVSGGLAQTQRSFISRGFLNNLYQHVRDYAFENMGKKFLVCLPKSNIMNRIWSGLPVPTRTDRPEIEYKVDDRGYWEVLPFELDGLVNSGQAGSGTFTIDEERQIIKRFMSEDGRFYSMVGIDHKPTGNINFNANGLNSAMFQDLPVSDFRPNKIASNVPTYVLSACTVDQLVKRPDLALVELPNTISFDPQVSGFFTHGYVWNDGVFNDDKIMTKQGIIKMLWYFFKRDIEFRSVIIDVATAKFGNANQSYKYASKVISTWAEKLRLQTPDYMQRHANIEPVMDLKGVIIPLTSTWVSYGPWFATSGISYGMNEVQVDDGLVPWNFDRPTVGNWDDNLNAAGEERLDRTVAATDYLDNAVISVAGFPEMGLGSSFGYNSNLTSISVDFGIQGVKTIYNLSTYLRRPGTYRKSEYDDVSRSRFKDSDHLPETKNVSITTELYGKNYGPNKFRLS